MLLDSIKKIVPSADTIQIFGPSGSGKSSFAISVIKQMAAAGVNKILYLDTERNLMETPTYCDYKYLPSYRGLYDAVSSLKPGYKMVVIDSLGLPILGEFAKLSAREKGDILLGSQSISYQLKQYSKENDCYVIVLNQPESEFAKEKGHVLEPFGDKAKYYFKEIWKTRMSYSMPDKTGCIIEAFRSRMYGREKLLFSLAISNNGVEIKSEVDGNEDGRAIGRESPKTGQA
jgi:RecA/RadA recombinase